MGIWTIRRDRIEGRYVTAERLGVQSQPLVGDVYWGYVSLSIYIYVHMYIYTYIYIYTHTFIHMYIYVYVYVYVYVYIYIYIYIVGDWKRVLLRPKCPSWSWFDGVVQRKRGRQKMVCHGRSRNTGLQKSSSYGHHRLMIRIVFFCFLFGGSTLSSNKPTWFGYSCEVNMWVHSQKVCVCVNVFHKSKFECVNLRYPSWDFTNQFFGFTDTFTCTCIYCTQKIEMLQEDC